MTKNRKGHPRKSYFYGSPESFAGKTALSQVQAFYERPGCIARPDLLVGISAGRIDPAFLFFDCAIKLLDRTFEHFDWIVEGFDRTFLLIDWTVEHFDWSVLMF